MLKLTIRPEDVKAGKIITPGKYRFRIQKIYPKASKGDKSTNYVFEFLGLEGAAEGVPVTIFYNEKLLVMILPLLQALGQEVSEENVTDVDLETALNMEVYGFVTTGMYNNRPTNTIEAWESINAGAAA